MIVFKRLIFIVLFLVFSSSLTAGIKLNISMIFKWGIDKGLVLKSELHSVEDLEADKIIVLEINDGPKIELSGNFIKDEESYGPGNLVQIIGQVYFNGEMVTDSFFKDKIIIRLEESKIFTYKGKMGQLIEVTMTPKMK